MAGVVAPPAPSPAGASAGPGPAAGIDERRMAGVASLALAVATWSAAAAGGLTVPVLILAPLLLAGAAGAMARRSLRVLPAGKDVLVMTAVTCAGLVVVYVAGWATQDHLVDIARLLPAAVVGLSVLWPEPNVLRYCLLLCIATLLGTPQPSRPALLVALSAGALALVATHRLVAASGTRLGGAPPVRARRVAAEAAAVLVIVGLLAALAASLVPPPSGAGGGLGDLLAEPGPLPQPAAPAVHFEDRLDAGGGRGGRGNQFMLLVGAREPDVWRALTYDHWDGETWSRSSEERVFVGGEAVEPGIGDAETAFASPGLIQRVTVLARSADVLVAAPRPTYAAVPDDEVEQGADASLYPTSPLVRGGRYFVVSARTAASAEELRALGDTPARVVPADVAGAYLQLPQVSPRVRHLAAQLAAAESSSFDTASAVEAWIDANTTVTDDATEVPAGADPVEAFLLEGRSGPPERAATAMVVMLRAVGIPARLAVGFLPGRRSGVDEPFVVRASDTHAWVEVWFPSVGWQRFDPTGRAPDPRPDPESVWDRLLRFLAKLWPLLVLAVVAGAGWLAWRLAEWRRRRAALPWATLFFSRVERAGRARGRPRRPPETPAEYARALSKGALPDPRLPEVGELVTVAAWSRHEPAAEDKARAEAVLRAAIKATPARRLRRRPYISRRLRRRR